MRTALSFKCVAIYDACHWSHFGISISYPALSPNEEKLVFGCSDNSLVILDTKTKSVEQVSLSIRPTFFAWHPLNHFFVVASRQGEALLFDVGLSQLDWIPIRENAESDRILNLKLPSLYTKFTMLKKLVWVSPHQVFLITQNTPLVVLHFPFGVFGQGALALVKEHVRKHKYQEAIKVLYRIQVAHSTHTSLNLICVR